LASRNVQVVKLGGDWTVADSGLKRWRDASRHGWGGKEMGFIIPKHILDAATKCKRNLSCLRNGSDQACCTVAKEINGLLFVDFRDALLCGGYNLPFGRADMCTCPVRKERYARYKI